MFFHPPSPEVVAQRARRDRNLDLITFAMLLVIGVVILFFGAAAGLERSSRADLASQESFSSYRSAHTEEAARLRQGR